MSDDTPTVELGDTEVNAARLLEAVEDLPNKDTYGPGDVGVSGIVYVFGDHDESDPWVFVSQTRDRVVTRNDTSIDSFASHDLRERAEEALEEYEPTFEEYLKENVFTDGEYTYGGDAGVGDVRVAENGDGSGQMIESDLQRAIEDDNVGVVEIDNGWLVLNDNRDE